MGGERGERDELVWPRERSDGMGDYRHFRVRRDWNRSPDTDEPHDFYILEMPDWVQVVPVTTDGRLVMVEQFRPGSRTVTLEFPAGLMEDGESPAECAVRELEEETGYRGDGARVIGRVYANPALQDNLLHIVLVEGCRPEGERNEDPGEVIRTRLMTPAEVEARFGDEDPDDAYGLVAWYYFDRLQEGAGSAGVP